MPVCTCKCMCDRAGVHVHRLAGCLCVPWGRYVLGVSLVSELSAIGAMGGLRLYENDDLMVGAWLTGHRVDRARLVAKEYLDMW